jgi:hypothetical protein
MSLFSGPKIPDAPKEDPAVTAARKSAQDQADASLTTSIQDNLRASMQARQQRFGLVPTGSLGFSRRPPQCHGRLFEGDLMAKFPPERSPPPIRSPRSRRKLRAATARRNPRKSSSGRNFARPTAS